MIKPLVEFYKHPKMSDGHLNKCTECAKKDSRKRYNTLIDNFSFLEKERIRRHEKYIRLGMKKNTNKKSHVPKMYKSHIGKVHHHWSYLKKHCGDCFLMDISCHSYIHKHIERTKDGVYWCFNGEILDSKDKHQAAIIEILTSRGRKCEVYYTNDGVNYELVLKI